MPSSRHGSQPRQRSSRHPSPLPYVLQPENLILPDGPVGEEAAELLNELVHHHHEDTLVQADVDDDDTEEDAFRRRLPWWKRPSPWWLLAMFPLSAVAVSATLAPRIEIYTLLACAVHKPEIFESYSGSLTGISPRPVSLPIRNTLNHSKPGSPSGLNSLSNAATLNPCASDPVVQAAVATLTAVITAIVGTLSCLTTGWWGSFSDRYGRIRVLGIGVCGVLVSDFNFIFVTLCFRHLPGGYWFLVVGAIVDGCAGGATGASAAMHAYLADTTTESTRSRIFSLSLGLFFIGMTFGPTMGGLLIRFTGHALYIFYGAAFIHFLYACMVWFVIPESLSVRQMEGLRHKHMAEADQQELRSITRRAFGFLKPLSLLMPEIRGEDSATGNSLKGKGRDWTLTLVAAAYGCTVIIFGAYTYTLQYAASTFSWSSEIFGFFISLVGAVRAIFLTIILPLSIKLFKHKPVVKRLSVDPLPNESSSSNTPNETQPLLTQSSPPTPTTITITPANPNPPKQLNLDSSHFDLALARVSLVVDIVTYALLVSTSNAVAFTLAVLFGAMGAGFNPAVQSVALALYRRRGGTESGKLFGALSVVQALSSGILGPAMYGLIYTKTVATFPRMIFVVSLMMVSCSFLLLTFVRLPKDALGEDVDVEGDGESASEVLQGRPRREETLVDVGDSGNTRV